MAKKKRGIYGHNKVTYRFRNKKTGKSVNKAYARRYRHLVRRERVYFSLISNRVVSSSRVNSKRDTQGILETNPRLSLKGVRKTLKDIKFIGKKTREELEALPENYSRWLKWLAKNRREVLPETLIQAFGEGEAKSYRKSYERQARREDSLRPMVERRKKKSRRGRRGLRRRRI